MFSHFKARIASSLWPRRTMRHLATRNSLRRTRMILMRNKVSHFIFVGPALTWPSAFVNTHFVLFLQVWSYRMETSTGTAHVWVAWPVDRVAPSSRRPFPVSTTAKRRWKAQSASSTSATCRSVCRGTPSFIPRRKTKSKRSPTLVLLHLLKVTIHRQPQHPSLLRLTAQHLPTE